MDRPLRVEFPGAIYYVMARSNQGALLFRPARERELFLSTLGETAAKTHVQVHAYCLMGSADRGDGRGRGLTLVFRRRIVT